MTVSARGIMGELDEPWFSVDDLHIGWLPLYAYSKLKTLKQYYPSAYTFLWQRAQLI